MKQRRFAMLAAAMMLGSMLTGCSTTQNGDLTAQVASEQTAKQIADEAFLAAETGFALSLMKETLQADPNGNLLLSPYSLMQVLALTANGAAGETQDEMRHALGGVEPSALNDYLCTQRKEMPDDRHARLRTANSVWLRESDVNDVKKDFLSCAKNQYDAGVFRAAFDDSTVSDINEWCSDRTKGMIPKITDHISEDTVMMLLNAVSFEADWDEKYEEEPLPYLFTAAGNKPQTKMMMFFNEHAYLEDDNATGFIKYYRGDKYCFAALLPKPGMTPEEYLSQLIPEDLRYMLLNPVHTNVYAGIPVFSLETETDLIPALQKMGMQKAFQADADFSGMADATVQISEIIQKAKIQVDTDGTKASAVTRESVVSGAPESSDGSKVVILERPFVYLILETEDMVPVFAGVMNRFD